MKNFIRIQSERNIVVTGGLQSINMTNKDAHVADRLNVKSAWAGLQVLVKKGTGYYPSEIKNWPTVQRLVKKNILTLGEEVDVCPTPEQQTEAEKLKKQIRSSLAKTKTTAEAAKTDSVAGKIEKADIKF